MDVYSHEGVPLLVNLLVRGQRLHISRSIQVNPNAPMRVTFDAAAPIFSRVDNDLTGSVMAFLGLLMVLSVSVGVGRILGGARSV